MLITIVTTRKATPEDINVIKYIADCNKPTVGVVRRWTLIEAIYHERVMVAEVSGLVVGFAIYQHQTKYAQMILWKICVAEQYRGQRIGSSLIQAIKNEARAAGKARILLKAPDSEEANGFYERVGFVQVGAQREKKRVLNLWEMKSNGE